MYNRTLPSILIVLAATELARCSAAETAGAADAAEASRGGNGAAGRGEPPVGLRDAAPVRPAQGTHGELWSNGLYFDQATKEKEY